MIRRDVTANDYLRSGGVSTVSAIVTWGGVLPKRAVPNPSLATEPRILPDCPACGDMPGNDDLIPAGCRARISPSALRLPASRCHCGGAHRASGWP
jgi:hypothetical protein